MNPTLPKQVQENPSKEFWENKNFLAAIDMLAQRYGKLPSEILASDIFDFSFDMAVMMAVCQEERKESEPKPAGTNELSNFGLSYEVKGGSRVV